MIENYFPENTLYFLIVHNLKVGQKGRERLVGVKSFLSCGGLSFLLFIPNYFGTTLLRSQCMKSEQYLIVQGFIYVDIPKDI